MTNNQSNEFNNLYVALTDKEKDMFSDITLRLIKVNFIIKERLEDQYMFILTNKELFKLFFMYMNFDFYLLEHKELAYIKTESSINRISANETKYLLVLRLLYQLRVVDTSVLTNEIKVSEFKEKLTDLFNIIIKNNNELNTTLRYFKAHNIIYYKKELNDDDFIKIYPSIEFVFDFRKFDEILIKIESFKGGDDNEVDES